MGPNQRGFVKSRPASDSTRRMNNLLQHVENNQMPSLLLALDVEKAFDTGDTHRKQCQGLASLDLIIQP